MKKLSLVLALCFTLTSNTYFSSAGIAGNKILRLPDKLSSPVNSNIALPSAQPQQPQQQFPVTSVYKDKSGQSKYVINEAAYKASLLQSRSANKYVTSNSGNTPKKTGYKIIKYYDQGKLRFDRVKPKNIKTSGIAGQGTVTYQKQVVKAGGKREDVVRQGCLQGDEFVRYANDDSSAPEPLSWGVTKIGADLRKKEDYADTQKVIVAVVDTGVDYNHKYLKGRMIKGYDFVDQDTDPMDENIHGTHVAGIIVSSTPDRVRIMPVRVLDKNGEGNDTNIANGIIWASDHGAQIINMSFGGPGYSGAVYDAVKYAQSKGIMLVAAAGNDSKDTEEFYPASIKECITVSAVDENDVPASFSNHGASVDLAAPGVHINSCMPGNTYTQQNGTSMAAPFVAAAAAVTMLKYPSIDSKSIESILEKCATDLGDKGWDMNYGYGLLSLKNIDKLNDPLVLLSPGENQLVYEDTGINYSTKGFAGGKVEFLIDGVKYDEEAIANDGFQSNIINFKSLTADLHTVTLQVFDSSGKTGPSSSVIVKKVTYNCSLNINDIGNNPVNIYDFSIWGIKGNSEELILHNYDTDLIRYESDGTYRFNLDFDDLNSNYEKIVAIATVNQDNKVPVYIREIATKGKYIFAPTEKTRKIHMADKFYAKSSDRYGIIGTVISPQYKNFIFNKVVIFKSLDIKGETDIYTDDVPLYISCATTDFKYSEVLNKGGGNVNIIITKNKLVHMTANIPGDRFKLDDLCQASIGVFSYINNSISDIAFDLCDLSKPETEAMSSKKIDYWITPGKYYISYRRYITETKKFYELGRYDIIEKNTKEYSISFGGVLTNEIKVDYSYDWPKFCCKITDSYGNQLSANSYSCLARNADDFNDGGIYVTLNSDYGVDPNTGKVYKRDKPIIKIPNLIHTSVGSYSSHVDSEVTIPWFRWDSFSFLDTSEIPLSLWDTTKYTVCVYYNDENGPFEVEFNNKEINIGAFYSYIHSSYSDNNLYSTPPKYCGLKYYAMNLGDTLQIPINELFIDPDGVKLELTAKLGMIYKDTFYFKALEAGVCKIPITVYDYSSAPVEQEVIIFIKGSGMVDVPTEGADYNLRNKALPDPRFDGERSTPVQQNYQEGIFPLIKQLRFHMLENNDVTFTDLDNKETVFPGAEIWEKQLDFLTPAAGKTYNFISLTDESGKELKITPQVEDPNIEMEHGEDDFFVININEQLKPETWYTLNLPRYFLRSWTAPYKGGKICFKTGSIKAGDSLSVTN